MNNSDLLSPAPPEFKWPRCPGADAFIRHQIDLFLDTHPFAKKLSQQMHEQTSTEILVWVDHLIIPENNQDTTTLAEKSEFLPCSSTSSLPGLTPLWHPFADLPWILLDANGEHLSLAIKVENIDDFLKVHNLNLTVEGSPLSDYRRCKLAGEKGDLWIVERKGARTFIPSEENGKKYAKGLEQWLNRNRQAPFKETGMKETLNLAKKLVQEFGTGMASCIFLEGERIYWQSKNHAAQVQKSRQDQLGLGWANHDHHTFRSSRSVFPLLIEILKTFGFKKRERFYAGAEAGWGAQVMEQPEAGFIIFADVDLTPEDASVDFSTETLPDLKKPGTVGLWCALHGESMLEAGMHHLEAKFEFDALKKDLAKQSVGIMNPFSDFPHLRQAFTEGELWKVSDKKLDELLQSGQLSKPAYEKIKAKGAVGSHLENLQRRDGFKGFNQRGVSDIITAVNPEKQAMKSDNRKES